MAWTWYGPPTGSRLSSRTHSASSDAGAARILSVRSCGSTASVGAVPRTWVNATTSPLILLYFWTAMSVLYCESSCTSSTLYFPATPPEALSALKYTSLPAVSGCPITATVPVSGVSTPSLIVLPSKPAALFGAPAEPPLPPLSLPAPPQAATTSATVTASATLTTRIRRLLASVGEGPGLEVGLDPKPDAGEPSWREHGDEAVPARLGGHAGDDAGVLVDERRQRADEDRAEDRPEDRAETADDDDRDVLDGQQERPVVGADVLLVGAEQRAGHGRDRAGHHERADLVPAGADADDLGGLVVVADRAQRPAGTRADEVLRQQRDDRDETPDEPEVALVAGVGRPGELQRAEVDGSERGLRADGRAV